MPKHFEFVLAAYGLWSGTFVVYVAYLFYRARRARQALGRMGGGAPPTP